MKFIGELSMAATRHGSSKVFCGDEVRDELE